MSDENKTTPESDQGNLFGPNPALYRELNQPWPNATTAEAALTAFLDDVASARRKHRIADVVVLSQVTVTDADGREGDRLSSSSLGDSKKVLPMIAMAFGAAQEQHTAELAAIVAGAKRGARGG